MKTILRESMTKLHLGQQLTVRVWRQEDLSIDPDNKDLIRVAEDLVTQLYTPNHGLTMLAVAKVILDMDRVNAVEILGPNGNGEVLYADWP